MFRGLPQKAKSVVVPLSQLQSLWSNAFYTTIHAAKVHLYTLTLDLGAVCVTAMATASQRNRPQCIVDTL